MPNHASHPPHPRRNTTLLSGVMAGLFGLFCGALGISWFVAGPGALLRGFPHSLGEAVASAAGGMAVVFWAIRRIRGELAGPAPAAPAQQD